VAAGGGGNPDSRHVSVAGDLASKLTGINYAPVLPIIIGLGLVLLRLLKLDIDRSRQERRMRRLTQKLAILEQEIEQLRHGRAVADPLAESRDKPN
jgi:hypothetical protein